MTGTLPLSPPWGDMFFDANSFDQDISNWNTSTVWDMRMMFEGADSFNQDISDWNVSIVTRMNNMFGDAVALSDSNKGMIEASFLTPTGVTIGMFTTRSNQRNFQTAVIYGLMMKFEQPPPTATSVTGMFRR